MRIENVPNRLDELFRERGHDPSTADASAVWEAFCQLAQERIDGLHPGMDDDLLLFEVGPGDSDEVLLVDIERQYGGEGNMQSLLCRLSYPAGAAPSNREVQIWGRPGQESSAWIGQVEQSPHAPLLRTSPTSLLIRHSRI
jgi:hypothetical protein